VLVSALMALPESLAQQVRGRRRAFRRRILQWVAANLRSYPWRGSDRTSYQILVAELLLKRTTATAAAKVYEGFLSRFPSMQAVADAPLSSLEEALSRVGLQHQRAKGFKEAANYVVAHGAIPGDHEALSRVPHVGPYSAAAITSFAYGVPAAVVDSNVERILKRVFRTALPDKPNRALLEGLAWELLPLEEHRQFNWGLLDLGALVCRYVRPRCAGCPLRDVCDFATVTEGDRQTVGSVKG